MKIQKLFENFRGYINELDNKEEELSDSEKKDAARILSNKQIVMLRGEGYSKSEVARIDSWYVANELIPSHSAVKFLRTVAREIGPPGKLPLGESKRPSKSLLEKAVKSLQLYLGGVDWVGIKDQEKLYNRAIKLVGKVADATGLPADAAWEQIEAEARKRGITRPRLGQHV